MKTLTIDQKCSNSGSIYDLASNTRDRLIKFAKGTQYAVVYAAYYNIASTTHKSARAAITASQKATKEGYHNRIVDADGIEYEIEATYWDSRLNKIERV